MQLSHGVRMQWGRFLSDDVTRPGCVSAPNHVTSVRRVRGARLAWRAQSARTESVPCRERAIREV